MSPQIPKRPFRSEASLTAEREARDAVAPFLSSRDYRVLDDKKNTAGTAVEQFISALSSDGQPRTLEPRAARPGTARGRWPRAGS